ncbi:exosome complex exonuclease Rrp40 [Aspergillus sclerotialis]|uniref:Exosome complex exonuclease Rrp40 n=1 Tax=Aspergillus sclerotialis TaxID=2070753 RepID=A0A3A2ZCI8_9EURO|nr:exosome complex exonuclease Rrp40 [Aspergillus sclerotialis]
MAGMAQELSAEANTGSDELLKDGNNMEPVGNQSNAARAKQKKEKKSKRGEFTSQSERKRKSLPNVVDQPSSQSTPSLSQPQTEQRSRPSKRKRVSEPAQKTTDSREIDDEPATNNSTVAINGHGPPGNSERPSLPNQPKQPKRRNTINSAPVSTSKSKAVKKQRSSLSAKRTASLEDDSDQSGSRPQGHRSESNRKVTGFFTPEEVETIESFKLGFCNDLRLTGDTFDRMVQHSGRIEGDEFPGDSIITKQEFWQTIYGVLPNRDRRSIYRFMRRHFQASTQKPHQWTEEQDDELIGLYAQHGAKWLTSPSSWVGMMMMSCNGGKTGLSTGIQCAEGLAKAGTDVGKDMYEMDETLLSWGVVSDKLKNCRSRQQCADKWRKIRRYILTKRASGFPDAVYNAEVECKPRRRSFDPQKANAGYEFKSQEYVDSDVDEDENKEGSKDDNGPSSKSQAARQRAKPQKPVSEEKKAAAKQANRKPTSTADESGFGSESEYDSHVSDSQREEEQRRGKTSIEQERRATKKKDRKEPGSVNGVKAKENGENPQKKPKHIETPKETPKFQPSFISRSPEESSKKQREEGEPKEKDNNPNPSIAKTQERGTAAQPNEDRSPSASSDSEGSEDVEDAGSVSLTPERPETKATKSTPAQKELVNANPSEGKTSNKQDDEESSNEEGKQSENESASSRSDEEQTEPPTMNNKRKAEPDPAQNVNPSPKRMKIEPAESSKASSQAPSEESSSESENDDDDESDSELEAKPVPTPEPKPRPKPEPRFGFESKRLTLKQLKEQTLNRNPVRPSISDPPPQPSGSRARSRSASSSDSDSSSSSSNG